jgi:hypothetical protein
VKVTYDWTADDPWYGTEKTDVYPYAEAWMAHAVASEILQAFHFNRDVKVVVEEVSLDIENNPLKDAFEVLPCGKTAFNPTYDTFGRGQDPHCDVCMRADPDYSDDSEYDV